MTQCSCAVQNYKDKLTTMYNSIYLSAGDSVVTFMELYFRWLLPGEGSTRSGTSSTPLPTSWGQALPTVVSYSLVLFQILKFCFQSYCLFILCLYTLLKVFFLCIMIGFFCNISYLKGCNQCSKNRIISPRHMYSCTYRLLIMRNE